MVNSNMQTTLIPAGGSAIVELKADVPGTFILVDHSIFRAFNKGALGMLKVSGPEDKMVYSGKQNDLVYQPEGGAIQSVAAPPAVPPASSKADRIARGQRTFANVCAACHQPNGQGLEAAFPPLAGSDFLNADKRRAIGIVLHGFSGSVTVNGKTFNSVMPALGFSDEEIANVLTFVYNSWNNAGYEVTPAEVKAVRDAGPGPGAAAGAQ
jgi:nitrite reductase (NO-forming)